MLSTVSKANEFIFALKGENDQDIVTEIRMKDGFINATKLCKSAGKLWADYYRLKKTQAFLNEICKNIGNNIDDIIESEVGGVHHNGTWVHPQVATNLALWCSIKFGAKVSLWIEEAKRKISNINDEWIHEICNIEPNKNTLVEKNIRDRLSNTLNGKTEIECGYGYIDIVTDNQIIEVKNAIKYLSALGQILAYSIEFPEKIKRIHLFYDDEVILNNIVEKAKRLYGTFDILLTYELIEDDTSESVKEDTCESVKDDTDESVEDDTSESEDENITHLIEIKDRLIEKLKNDNIRLIEKLKNDNVLLIKQKSEETKQCELQIKLEEIRNQEKNKIVQVENEFEKTRQDAIEKIKNDYEQIKIIEDELNAIKKDEEEPFNPIEDLKAYIIKYCEFGTDSTKERYRIMCKELYEHYCKKIPVPMEEIKFKEYLQNNHELKHKACNWYSETHNTWFGIRIKEFSTKKLRFIQQLIVDFVDEQCVIDKDSIVDTKIFYDKFEEYSLDKGFDAIKKNGFTRQLFRIELIKTIGSISVKEWAIDGNKHAFLGVRLKSSSPQLHDATIEFVKKCCVKGYGYRTKTTDIWKAFCEFSEEKYDIKYPKIKFYKIFKEQNKELIIKCISKSDKGFIGIMLREEYNKLAEMHDELYKDD
jgi:hypothetical protein